MKNKGMEEVTIYRFQLEKIQDALRITSNIHNCSNKVTCHDRMVHQAKQYVDNALEGEKNKRVPYL